MAPDEDGVQRWLGNVVMLSNIERLAGDAQTALELADEALAHPSIDRNRGTQISAYYARAYALARLASQEALSAFEEAKSLADADPGMLPPDRAYAEAIFHALTGSRDSCLTALTQAVDGGYSDAVVLTQPEFAAFEDDPGFRAAP